MVFCLQEVRLDDLGTVYIRYQTTDIKCSDHLIGGTPLTPLKIRNLNYLHFGLLNCVDVRLLQWSA